MNEETVKLIIIIVLSIISGILGVKVYDNRKSVDTVRGDNNDAERRYSDSLETIAEIRKNQRIDVQDNNSRNNSNCNGSNTDNNSNIKV